MSKFVKFTAFMIFIVGLALGLGRSAELLGQGGMISVSITDFAFTPKTITVPVGSTVRWTNNGNAPHTVTSTSSPKAFDSGTLNSGDTFQHTFTATGQFPYRCNIHPSMTGMVIVEQQKEEVQEFALIHSLAQSKTFPEVITVSKGVKVRLFNTALDGVHPSMVISSDEDGKNPVFGVKPFSVEPGKLTTVEFTPDKAGTFFISHRPHGHNIVGKLVVKE
ncbi:MAG: cupredoxin domain-containing protein [Candidatus Bipolaricaulota bacterium]|nr:cupredoxin domain-containing protein [Candidatus Bipolaricaulota bacterium]